jgi:hypothetical protein
VRVQGYVGVGGGGAVGHLAVRYWNLPERERMEAWKLVVRVANTGGIWSRCGDHNTIASGNKINMAICAVWHNPNMNITDTSVYLGRNSKSWHVYLSGLLPNCLSTSARFVIVNGLLMWVQKIAVIKNRSPEEWNRKFLNPTWAAFRRVRNWSNCCNGIRPLMKGWPRCTETSGTNHPVTRCDNS